MTRWKGTHVSEPNSEQLVLPVEPLAVDTSENIPAGLSIQERFERFHELNPWIYRSFEMLTEDWVTQGRARIGIGMLTEVLRWQYGRQTIGDDFKINNNFRSRYVRLLIRKHPEWADMFETRQLKSA